MSSELNRLVTPLLLSILPAIEARIPRPKVDGRSQRYDNGRPANEAEAREIQEFYSSNPAILMRAMNLKGELPGESEFARNLREEKGCIQAELRRIENAQGTVEIPVSMFQLNARLAQIKKESDSLANEKYESAVFSFLKKLLTQFSNGERLHGLPVGSLVSYAEAHPGDLTEEQNAELKAYIERKARENAATPQENGLPDDLA